MGLPAKLTDEEQALLNKFALLKKKKKVSNHVKNTVAVTAESNNVLITTKKEKPSENTALSAPKDAKEIAKRLIASGQLKITKGSDNRSFKRARPTTVAEKKVKKPSMMEAPVSSREQSRKIENIRKGSYNSFVQSGNEKPERPEKDIDFDQYRWNKFSNKRQGNNLFIAGYGLTKNILDNSFPQFGQVNNICMDEDKGHGFVTYQKRESAEKAIAELHGTMVQGVTLRVTHARRQPYDVNRRTWRPHKLDDEPTDTERRADGPRSDVRLANASPPKPHKGKQRELLAYDAEVFDF